MKERLELSINRNRKKLRTIEEQISNLNSRYMSILDLDDNNIHLKRIENEINLLERQQESIVRIIRDKKRQLNELYI